MLRATHSPTNSSNSHPFSRPPLRILASGTVFITQKLLVSSHPEAGGVARAQSVEKSRGGHSANVLAVLSQFRIGEVQFSGPLPGSDEGGLISRELEYQGVGTLFSILRENKGVPTAWIIEARKHTPKNHVRNHNPLPDMSHEEFVSRLGPILAPENYDMHSNPFSPSYAPSPNPPTHAHLRRRSGSGQQVYGSPPNGHMVPSSPYSPYTIPGMPPFDWIHFEGRNPQVTYANMNGLDGLARERGWRTRCVFSLQIGRPGSESLIQHADIVFFSKLYAQVVSPSESPRAFLISMCSHAAPHSLLVVDWGVQGAALLSVPTREYLQSSGWVEPTLLKPTWVGEDGEPHSVHSGSGFWADGRPASNSTLTTSALDTSQWLTSSAALHMSENARGQSIPVSEGDSDSRRTSIETERGLQTHADEVGAHEAFVAGMIFALSQRLMPGRPYAGSVSGGADKPPGNNSGTSGRWRLEECLRFATELAGRKGRRAGFEGLRVEMERGGWVIE
ncbi:hypothetical protein BU17DRAFT_55849 [Hysterangium stoloniferum]|nr:hypothetical protein BU17DRAFT_55849 [Hysterangium stoloniferum]